MLGSHTHKHTCVKYKWIYNRIKTINFKENFQFIITFSTHSLTALPSRCVLSLTQTPVLPKCDSC
eukprot:m.32991 g.32991  ORF g.32991 m.32991 type:complete len:65 (-) comp9826_c0_seq1:1456-1650(-)